MSPRSPRHRGDVKAGDLLGNCADFFAREPQKKDALFECVVWQMLVGIQRDARARGPYSERRLATGGQIQSSVRGAAASDDRAVAAGGGQELTCRSSAETWFLEVLAHRGRPVVCGFANLVFADDRAACPACSNQSSAKLVAMKWVTLGSPAASCAWIVTLTLRARAPGRPCP